MLKEYSVEQFEKELSREGRLLLDVRTDEEYFYGHLSKSTLIPVHELPERLEEIAQFKEKPVRIYCRSGVRSVTAGEFLLDQGFTDVAHLEPGITGWIMEERKVVL